jgi:two-component system response regulator NreC
VRTVAAGSTYLQPELGARLLAAPAPLTARERDVLRLLALGHTNAQTAERLHLSVRTVETHRANIRSKLGISDRAQLVRHALESGLISS